MWASEGWDLSPTDAQEANLLQDLLSGDDSETEEEPSELDDRDENEEY